MSNQKKTILIVDDAVIIQQRIALLLKSLEYAVRIVTSGSFADAVQVLREKPIHIALLDIHLQDRSGIDLLQLINEQYPEIIVIMVTNQAHPQTETRCKSMGATHFLDKSNDFAKIPGIILDLI